MVGMAPKRPTKIKQSIQKLRGVARDRAMHAEALIENNEYSREAADLVAYVAFPFDDDIEVTKEFSKEIGSLSMDVGALAETSSTGAAVNAAVMALTGFRMAAETHKHAYYMNRYDRALAEAKGTETRFGA
jgi:hypothetical protein